MRRTRRASGQDSASEGTGRSGQGRSRRAGGSGSGSDGGQGDNAGGRRQGDEDDGGRGDHATGGRQGDADAGQDGRRGQIIQWLVLACSGLLIVAAAGYIVYSEYRENAPATVEVEVMSVAGSDPYQVTIEVRNPGDRAAQHVTVEATLQVGESQESASLSFMFLPAHDAQRHVLEFNLDPRAGQLEFTVAFTPEG